MSLFTRIIKTKLEQTLSFGKSVLLFGPRQTGKTTLVKSIAHDYYINLMDATLLRKYEANHGILIEEIKALKSRPGQQQPLIIIDEIQKVPAITDAVQILIDEKFATFILTGSSARKIKNLLPGRVIRFSMSPLSLQECGFPDHGISASGDLFLDKVLVNGTLPEIINIPTQEQIDLQLDTYVNVYLEEEIRKEAIVRNMGAFNNFLRLACIESGNLVNLSKISQEVGVAHTTIASYYTILQECMLVKKIEPLVISNSRRNLTKAVKYLLFDLGIRRIGAMDPVNPTIQQKSLLFEQFIGLELHKLMLEHSIRGKLLFWRDHAGPEIDYLIEYENKYIPIEVKWTDNPTHKDIKHLLTFRNEYATSNTSYVICRVDLPRQLADNVIALPWQRLAEVCVRQL